MYVLDTDILIDVLRGHQPAINWFTALRQVPSIPGFVVMELIQNSKNKQQVNQVLKLIAPLPIIWLTEVDCAKALADFSQYHLSDGSRFVRCFNCPLCYRKKCNSLYF